MATFSVGLYVDKQGSDTADISLIGSNCVEQDYVFLRVPQESMSFGTCLFGWMCSWLKLIINRDKMQKTTADKETQIPSKKRKTKVQDTGKVFVHLQFYNAPL